LVGHPAAIDQDRATVVHDQRRDHAPADLPLVGAGEQLHFVLVKEVTAGAHAPVIEVRPVTDPGGEVNRRRRQA